MEYSLRNDFNRLRKEIQKLFPKLVKIVEFGDEIYENALYRNLTLKIISSKDEQDDILENFEFLQNTIEGIEEIAEDNIEFTQDLDREKQRKDFLNKLITVRGLTNLLEVLNFDHQIRGHPKTTLALSDHLLTYPWLTF